MVAISPPSSMIRSDLSLKKGKAGSDFHASDVYRLQPPQAWQLCRD
ncbi:hypothetical protein FVEG_14810 [Fusarium verticillioides 7600]|uniref:Uncharacterized protein n=1 Tax=Gibberella moniliformis (strain M3125 / FGSC 7600) TaxID=334819 RepID=W7LQW4_GIBM7|nr:hypothetical protein FVEG_14810 [Fusarium verticillioides 7600]EWG37914.1 hypothetical protein FVEG_14810 [Fusarium verticillioides 7600]